MQHKRTIAIVHSNEVLLASHSILFTLHNYVVRSFNDGMNAYHNLSTEPADVAILGRRLPGLSGPELFARLQPITRMPVIFLSSHGPDLADEVPGARDYLDTASCNVRTLAERVKIILDGGTRRLCIDSHNRVCTWRRQRLYLTMPEFLILERLAMRGVHTRFALMEAAYGADVDMDKGIVEAHLRSLRAKFRAIDPSLEAIEGVCGVAYRLHALVQH